MRMEPAADQRVMMMEPTAEQQMMMMEPAVEQQMMMMEPAVEQRVMRMEPAAEQRVMRMEPAVEQQMMRMEPAAEHRVMRMEPAVEQQMMMMEPAVEQQMMMMMEPAVEHRVMRMEPAVEQRVMRMEPAVEQQMMRMEPAAEHRVMRMEPAAQHRVIMMEPAPQPQALVKPPYSYVALIAIVLEQSPERRLPLSGIYEAITRYFPYYARQPRAGWQNSVRHNLSLNPCFSRLPPQPGQRCGLWVLRESVHDMFERGKYLRRRRPNYPEAPEHRAAPPAFRYHDPAGCYLPPRHYQLVGAPWGRSIICPNPVYPDAVPRGFQNEVPTVHYWQQEVHYQARVPATPGQEAPLLRTVLTD